MDELEIVQHQYTEDLSVFVNTVRYRSPHFHQDWELLWVLDTALLVTCGAETTTLHPGEVVLFSPNQAHELHQADQVCTFLCIQISSGILTRNVVMDHIRLEPYLSTEAYQQVRRMMLEIARAYFCQEDYYEIYCRGKASLLLHLLVTSLPSRRMTESECMNIDRKNAKLLRLVDFVRNNYSHKILLSDFAKQENCSVSYLSHVIRESMNQTFQQYVASVRFANACKLIDSGKQSLVSISRATGFSDYRYFSKAFQDAYGMSPAEYGRQTHNVLPDGEPLTHSVHSDEKLLTRGQSLHILKRFEENMKQF